MSKNIMVYLVVVFSVAILLFIGLRHKSRFNKLEKKSIKVNGQIVEIRKRSKYKKMVDVDYKFEILNDSNSAWFFGTAQSPVMSSLKPRLEGIKLPVVYSPNDPSINDMLIYAKDYARYKYIQPEFLKWIDSFPYIYE